MNHRALVIAVLFIALAALAACKQNAEPSFHPEDDVASNAGTTSGTSSDNAGDHAGAGAHDTPTPTKQAGGPRPGQIPAPPDVAAPPSDAVRTASGLAYKVLVPGPNTASPVHPVDSDRVSVHYTGWTTDGAMFDSSVQRGEPATFGVTQVIAGWTEMLKLMVEGEKVRVWIPENLAYGGRAGAPAGMLVFDVELLTILRPPPAPADVAAAPRDAERTASGLASKVIQPGTGTRHPAETSRVRVHYTGWTTDGNMFDSSLTRGQPATFPLNRVIAGWTEGVQLMVEGEKRRFWIPESLAYQGRPGAPAGMLVFDVELLEILD